MNTAGGVAVILIGVFIATMILQPQVRIGLGKWLQNPGGSTAS